MIYLAITSRGPWGEATTFVALPDPGDEDATVRAVVDRHRREGQLDGVRVNRRTTPQSESYTEYEVLAP